MKTFNNNTQSKTTKQGASTMHIGQYLRRWLGWSLVALTCFSVHAAPGNPYENRDLCRVIQGSGTFEVQYTLTDESENTDAEHVLFDGVQGMSSYFNTPNLYQFISYSQFAPTTTTLTPTANTEVSSEPIATTNPQTVYLSLGAGPADEVCTVSYTLTGDGVTGITRTSPVVYTRLAPPPVIANCTANDLNCIGEAINFNKTPFCDSVSPSQTPGHYIISTLFGKTVDTAEGAQPNDIVELIEEGCFRSLD